MPLTTASDTHGLGHIADRAPALYSLARGAGYSMLRAYKGRQGYDVALGDQPVVDPAIRPRSGEDESDDSKRIA